RIDRGEVSWHPPRAGLSRLPRPYREDHAVQAAGCNEQREHRIDRRLLDVSRRRGIGLVFQPSRQPVLRGRQTDEGPGRGLRGTQGLDARPNRALAVRQPRLRSGLTVRPRVAADAPNLQSAAPERAACRNAAPNVIATRKYKTNITAAKIKAARQ